MKRLLKGGRVVDPANGRDGVFDILIEGDRIARIGENLTVEDGTVVVERAPRAEIRLYAPEITGGADFDAVLDPDTGDLAPVTGLRICWGER